MIYARFRHSAREAYGVIEGEHIYELEGDIFGEHLQAQVGIPLSEAVLLAPVPRPGKILAAAVNYQSHAAGASVITKSEEAPPEPQLFLKPSSSVIGNDEPIVLPDGARRVDAEGELVAVIGRACRGVSADEALEYVFGYTCGNDVSARHWQRDDLQWWRAKGADTFSPIGPVIATELDPGGLELTDSYKRRRAAEDEYSGAGAQRGRADRLRLACMHAGTGRPAIHGHPWGDTDAARRRYR